MLAFLQLVWEWSVRSVTFVKHSFVMAENVYSRTLARAHCKMQYASNVNVMCTSMVDAFSIVHFVNRFSVKTINSNIRPSVKLLNPKAINVSRAINWVNTRVYVAKFVIAKIMYGARDSNTRKMHQFHAQNVITKHPKQRS